MTNAKEETVTEPLQAQEKEARKNFVRKSSSIKFADWVHVNHADIHRVSIFFVGLISMYLFILFYQESSSLGLQISLGSSGVDVKWNNLDVVTNNFLNKYPNIMYVIYGLIPFAIYLVLSYIFEVWIDPQGNENPIYLLDFATFKAPGSWRITLAEFSTAMSKIPAFTQDSLNFMAKMSNQSGVGDNTAWPPGLRKLLKDGIMDNGMESSRAEVETVLFSTVEDLLKKTNISPKDIDVLIINCSLFSPTPSLCSMVINHFQMKSDVASYNLSGMGCSASLIAVDLAKHLLNTRYKTSSSVFGSGSEYKYKLALVISTETITPNIYVGNERSFLLQNTLFRCGGAAILLSNQSQFKSKLTAEPQPTMSTVLDLMGGVSTLPFVPTFLRGNYLMGGNFCRAKFKLLCLIRTQSISSDSYQCVYETETIGEEGINKMSASPAYYRGVRLSKDIVKIAGVAMKENLTQLGPLVLSFTEQLKVVYYNVLLRALFGKGKSHRSKTVDEVSTEVKKPETSRSYVPNFKTCLDYFCIHAGGRGVLDGVEKSLQLAPEDLAPSRQTLYNHGNTSSSSIWYELEYVEQQMNLTPGKRVLQLAFGSGFKCNSAVWLSMKK